MIGKSNIGGENLNTQLTAQETLIQTITESLVGKATLANATADKIIEGFCAYVGQQLVQGTLKEGLDIVGLLGYTKYSVDSFTPSSTIYNSNTFTANHSLGEKPRMDIVISNATSRSYDDELILYVGYALSDSDSSDYTKAAYFKATGGNHDKMNAYYESAFSRTNANVSFYCQNYSLYRGVEYTLITMA